MSICKGKNIFPQDWHLIDCETFSFYFIPAGISELIPLEFFFQIASKIRTVDSTTCNLYGQSVGWFGKSLLLEHLFLP